MTEASLMATPRVNGELVKKVKFVAGLATLVVIIGATGCSETPDQNRGDSSPKHKVASKPEFSEQQVEDQVRPAACPKPPTEWKIPVGTNNPDADEERSLHLNAADYPEAEPVQETSIDLEMNGAYVRERTRALLNEAVGKPFEVRYPLGS